MYRITTNKGTIYTSADQLGAALTRLAREGQTTAIIEAMPGQPKKDGR